MKRMGRGIIGLVAAGSMLYVAYNGIANTGRMMVDGVSGYVQERIDDIRLSRALMEGYSTIDWNTDIKGTERPFTSNLESIISHNSIRNSVEIAQPELSYPLRPQLHEPNPTGGIPIISFHNIAQDDTGGLTITPKEFRSRIERLYDEGFVTVSLDELINNRLDEVVPEGRRAVVLTFDDAWQGQFRLTEDNEKLYVDPDSALGILQHFVEAHPDFRYNATFFVPFDNPPFAKPNDWTAMLRYLASEGLEVAAHTMSHASMRNLTLEDARYEIGRSVQLIEKATGSNVRYFSFPMGHIPTGSSIEDLLVFDDGNYSVNIEAAVKITGILGYHPTHHRFTDSGLLNRWEGSSPSHEFYKLFNPRNIGGPGHFYASPGLKGGSIITIGQGQESIIDNDTNMTDNTTSIKTIELTEIDPYIIIIPERAPIMDPSYTFVDILNDIPVPTDLNSYQFSMLQRIIPIVELLEEASARYDLNPLWLAQLYILESELNPIAHNTRTDDYGIAQMKMDNFEHGMTLVENNTHFRWNNPLNTEIVSSVYNPEHSIISSTARMRYNIELHKITDPRQLLALYRAGPGAIGPRGYYRQGEQSYISSHANRRYLAQVIARTAIADTESLEGIINNQHIIGMINATSDEQEIDKRYMSQIGYNLDILENTSNIDWFTAEMLVNATIFAKTLKVGYGIDITEEYDRIGNVISGLNRNDMIPDIARRYDYAMNVYNQLSEIRVASTIR
ncbi:MAG: polysaccharide deacetylase family protein [Candidatus Woesearchaeota archaeon]